MAKVKFVRGIHDNYNATTHADAVYFATDTKEIIMNGVHYVGALADKQDKLTSSNAGTGISIVDGVISSTLDMTLFRVVTALPTENIEENKIYLKASAEQDAAGKNIYEEWVYVSNDGESYDWEKIGEYKSDVDLSGYVQTDNVQSLSVKLGSNEATVYAPASDTATTSIVITPAAIGAAATSDLDWDEVTA